MILESIADPADPRLAAYRAVRDPEWVRRRGLFVAEGRTVVRELLAQPRVELCSLLLGQASHAALAPELERVPADLRVYLVSPAALAATSGVRFHQGCAGEARVPPEPDPAELIARSAAAGQPLVLLERVSDPDNVGAVFRNARAFGAGAVLLSPGCASPLYRKALRTSLGAGLAVPFATDPDWPAALERARRAGYTCLGFSPEAPGAALDAAAAPASGRAALLFGSEGAGLSARARAACDAQLRIAMVPGADSLNVATASGIALHHFRARPR